MIVKQAYIPYKAIGKLPIRWYNTFMFYVGKSLIFFSPKRFLNYLYKIVALLLFIIPSFVTAQTIGPGGITGPNVWFSADTGVTNTGNGTEATAWKNRSALVSPYTLTVNAGSPTYYSTTSSELVNYNPSIYFSSAVFQNSTALISSNTSSYSFFVVGADESSSQGYREIFSASKTQDDFSFFKDNGATASNGWNMWINAGGAYTTNTGAIGFANSGGCQGYYNGTNYTSDSRTQNVQPQIAVITGLNSNVTNPTTYIDGYQGSASHVTNNITNLFNGLAIGGEYNNNLSENYLGRIVEFIAYPSQLTAAQVQRVNSYLSIKWGTTLGMGGTNPNIFANDGNYNYLASDGTTIIWSATTNSTYKWNITGIGRDDGSGLNQKQSFSVNQSSPTSNNSSTNTYGALVTIGLGSIAATNAANANTFSANKSFDILGDNNSTGLATGGPPPTTLPSTYTASASTALWLSRTWCVQETGTPGTVQISIPSNYAELNNFMSSSPIYLVNYSSVAGPAQYYQLTLSGSNYVASIDFPSGTSYFTFCGTAATSPGGVTLQAVWYKADAGVTNTGNGTEATVWQDQSGNGYNLPVLAGSPTYYSTTTAKLINYNPSIYFSGTDAFENTSAFMPSTSDYSLFVVEADETTTNNTYHGIYGAGNNKDIFSFYKYAAATTSNGWNMWENNGGAYTTNTGAIGFANSGGCQGYYNGTNYTSDSRTQRVQPQIAAITKAYAAGSATPHPATYIDGYSGSLSNYAYSANLFQGLCIGDEYTNYLSEYFIGRIVEFIAFPSQLSATQVQQVNSYLSIKWGTTLGMGGTNPNIFANDGNYSYLASNGTAIWNATTNATYKWNITGIGRDDFSGLNQKQSFSVNQSSPTTNNSATNTYGALVTIGLGTIASTNAANPNTFSSDKSFDIFGDNNSTGLASGSPPPTTLPSTYTASASIWLNRTWCVQETGTPGTVQITIPTNYTEFNNFTANSPIYLVNYASTSGPAQYYQLTTSGSNYVTTVDFPSGTSYFTFCGNPVAFTTPGTYYYTPLCGITSVTVTCQGGGGGGGGVSTTADASAGGGAGGSCIQNVVTVVPGTTYTIVVGAGGAGGTTAGGNGQQGGSSFFGTSTVLAVGGNGGTGETTATSGPGGTVVATGNLPAAGYLFSYYGGSGGAGVHATPSSGGGGGGAGTGSAGGNSTTTGAGTLGGSGTGGPPVAGGAGAAGLSSTSSSGNNAIAVGGGGSGAVTKTTTGYAGGSGAAGQVSITQIAVPATPTVSTNNPAENASGLCGGTTEDSLYEFTIAVPATANALTGLSFVTTGSYAASDISNFILWVNTSNSLPTATATATITSPAAAGTQTFPAFSKTLNANTTYYFWITANIAATPNNARTISVSALTASNLTMNTCSNNITAYAGPVDTISSSTVKAIVNAAGANTICNNEIFTLQGATVGGSATQGAWSIASGSGALSSTSLTSTPAAVTFTPSGASTETVVLTLTSNGCFSTSNRTIYVISCGSQTITSSQSWVTPCGVTTITVACYGGGGGGGGDAGNGGGSGGGGGGGYGSSILTVTPGASYSVTVGAGGSAGSSANGGNGGSSWFSLNASGSIPASQAQGVLANGGSGGHEASAYAGGAGAVVGIGTYSITGGTGGSGTSGKSGGGGGASGSSSGTGAVGSASGTGVGGVAGSGVSGGGSGGDGGGTGSSGNSGSSPGGGGGGGGDQVNPGSAGGAGMVIITLPSSLTHPSGGSVPSTVYGCVNVPTTITGVTLSSVTTSLTWLTEVGTGSFSPTSCPNTCSITTTYTPSNADAVTVTVPLILTQNASATSTCDTYDYPFNFVVLSDTSWSGGTNTDWGTASNWCATSIPTSTVSVVIPSGVPHQPTISGTSQASCLDITLNSGATLTMTGTNTLAVYGNWTNNGTFTPASTDTIVMMGAADQYITGSGTQTFSNLRLYNTGTTGSNLINLSQPVTITNKLNLTKGILVTTANTLTLTNTAATATNAGNSGSFVNGPMTWSLSGSANTYVFPTGAGTSTTKYAPVALSGVTSAGSPLFTCKYFNAAYSPDGTSSLSTTVTNTLVTLSGSQYWTVTPSMAATASVTLYWFNAAANGINNCADLVVAHYNNSTLTNNCTGVANVPSNKWENTNTTHAATISNAATACTGTGSGYVIGGPVCTFSPFTFGSTVGSGQNPLPIGLLYFNAIYNGESVTLSWATATETNNDYFTIERSLDGIHYVVVGTVLSQAVNGNSISELSYIFNDPNSTTGVYYYRLVQTDLSGSTETSGVQEVTISGSVAFSFEIAPNPNNGKQMTFFISDPISDQTITVNIHSILGQEIFSQNFTTGQVGNSSFPLYFQETLSSGVYIVTVSSDNQPTLSRRLIIE